jgi:starch synthase
MISAALDIQGERAHQQVGETSTVGVLSAKSVNAPVPKTLAPVASQNPNKKKVLFVTSEIADLVKTGGLGDVSAALPRAMAHLHDVRVLIPGYPQVMNSENPIHIIGELGGHAALPPCKIGRMDMPDGLVIYVLICPELYEREGSP